MYQRIALIMFSLLGLESATQGMSPIDNFIRDHCTEACTGESDECRACYNEAVDLFHQSSPSSQEIEWGTEQEGIELEFD